PPHNAARVAAQCNRVIAGADRVASGHQGRTGWRALRLDDVVRQLDTLGGELIRALGVRSSEDPAAVAAQLAHAEVIDMKEEDVWFLRGHGLLPVDGSFYEDRRGGPLSATAAWHLCLLGRRICLLGRRTLLGIHGATLRPGTPHIVLFGMVI